MAVCAYANGYLRLCKRYQPLPSLPLIHTLQPGYPKGYTLTDHLKAKFSHVFLYDFNVDGISIRLIINNQEMDFTFRFRHIVSEHNHAGTLAPLENSVVKSIVQFIDKLFPGHQLLREGKLAVII